MGVFSKSSRPRRPGAYFNWEAVQPAALPPAIGSVVAVGITHDWGPLQVATEVKSYNEFVAVFGDSDTPGSKAVREAFQGEGTPERGGAGTGIIFRMGGSSAAKATKVLTNTTPATALTLTARYEGSKGNDLKITVRDSAADATKTELLIYDGTVLLETFTFLDTDVAGLVAQINAGSAWVTAVQAITGVGLTTVTTSAMTGGDDGSTLLAGDYTDAMSALEISRFGVLVFENLTDTAIVASLKTWAVALNATGRRFFTVVGGALDETAATAITRSTTLNDPDFVNIGIGSVRDTLMLDVNGDPTVLSTAQLAPRIAGLLAARGERQSLTFAHLAGLQMVVGATSAEILRAFDAGLIVLSRDSNPLNPVRIEKGLTTYSTTTDPTRPYLTYRSTKAVATMHAVEMELAEWANAVIVGETTVDGETRAAVISQVNTIMARREADRIVQPGWTVIVDPSPPPSDDDEFVAFVIGARFGRSTEQVYFTGRLG